MSYSAFHSLMLCAASSLAFFGLLRCSEFTSADRHRYNSASTLMVNDIAFNRNGDIMSVFIKASKTDPFRVGCRVRIAAVGGPMCPVELMLQYLRARPECRGPLFIFEENNFLIRQDVVTFLRRVLPEVLNVNTHSFRIGGASAAASAGLPDSQIQILGRWSSDAYRRYLRFSDASVRRWCSLMSSVNCDNRHWDPSTATSRRI